MATRPNIVFITSHDTGRHFGCYGVPSVQTPNIDAMAADGVLLENFFCTSPVCSPSRGAMMSGLYPQTNGLMGLVHPPNNWTYRPGVKHLSKRLQELGYRTTLFFHQHEVMPDRVADRLSFDQYRTPQWTDASPEQVGEDFGGFLADYDGGSPFYAQIGFGLTHRAWDSGGTAPDDANGVAVPKHLIDNQAAREDLAGLQGSVKRLDGAIGMILDAIAASKFADDTIVIYTVDHGIETPRAKWRLYDPGVEVAFIIRCPSLGLTGGRRCGQLLSNVDVTPTLLELIGQEPAGGEAMDGRSFADVLADPDGARGREEVFAMFIGGNHPEARCIRTDRFKLIRNFSNHRLFQTPVDVAAPVKAVDRVDAEKDRSYCPVVELYDLHDDSAEFVNLAADPRYADTLRDLDDRLWAWLEDVDDPILQGPIQPPLYKQSIADYHAFKARK